MAESKKTTLPDLPAFASDIRNLLKDQAELPPVEAWQPERSGQIDIHINTQGEWLYQGEIMARKSVVQLLSRIMRKDGSDYYLVTPHEKLKISVEDVPFVVVMMDIERTAGDHQDIHFSTDLGDCFTLSAEHPLLFRFDDKGDPTPYVLVRHNLYARLARSVYYELMDHLVEFDDALSGEQVHKTSEHPQGEFGIWSAGTFFLV